MAIQTVESETSEDHIHIGVFTDYFDAAMNAVEVCDTSEGEVWRIQGIGFYHVKSGENRELALLNMRQGLEWVVLESLRMMPPRPLPAFGEYSLGLERGIVGKRKKVCYREAPLEIEEDLREAYRREETFRMVIRDGRRRKRYAKPRFGILTEIALRAVEHYSYERWDDGTYCCFLDGGKGMRLAFGTGNTLTEALEMLRQDTEFRMLEYAVTRGVSE